MINNILHRSLMGGNNFDKYLNRYFTLRALSDGDVTIHTPSTYTPIFSSLVTENKFNNPFISSCEIIVDSNGINENYVKSKDYFYEYGIEFNPDGIEQLCIYKSDEDYYLEEGVDYNDIFFYIDQRGIYDTQKHPII